MKSSRNGRMFRDHFKYDAAQVAFHGSSAEYTFFVPTGMSLSRNDIVVVALRKINPTLALGQVRRIIPNADVVVESFDYDMILAKVDLGLETYLDTHQTITLLP